MTGPGVPEDMRLDASILDLAPTLLRMLGLDVSQDVDGKILTPLLRRNISVNASTRL
jgi:arylsulfatase A-like enzyme